MGRLDEKLTSSQPHAERSFRRSPHVGRGNVAPMKQNQHRGVLHYPQCAAFGIVAFFITLHLCWAQERTRAVPEPAPTDAVKVSGRTIRVEGRASTRPGVAAARYAALLDAYGSLLKQGLQSGLFPGGYGEATERYRMFLVDSDHPAPDVISWISRSRIWGESDKDGEKILQLESPKLGTLATALPEVRAMTTQDVDSDGLSDVVAVGYDGSVYIMQSPSGQESKVTAKSESFALLELIRGPGYERVRATLPQDLGSVEVMEGGLARVLLELEMLEMVNGRLMGRTVERREVVLPLNSRLERIRFDIGEPPDFANLLDPNTELRGTAISEKMLENVEIRHNGEVAWQSPEGIGIRALKFNLARELRPGWNSFRLAARDVEGHSQYRELWIEGPDGMPASEVNARRAVVVSLDDKMKDERLVDALVEAGFSESQITILEGSEATVDGFLDAVRDNREARELLIYCETFTVPGSLVGGKVLRFPDGQVSATDLAQAIEAGGYRKTLGVVYSELPRGERGGATANELWRDTSTFLERLGSDGRLFIANVENEDESPRRQRKSSRERLLKGIKAKQGTDLVRLIDTQNPQNTLFRGWMHGSPVLR